MTPPLLILRAKFDDGRRDLVNPVCPVSCVTCSRVKLSVENGQEISAYPFVRRYAFAGGRTVASTPAESLAAGHAGFPNPLPAIPRGRGHLMLQQLCLLLHREYTLLDQYLCQSVGIDRLWCGLDILQCVQ
jgi:hypothetical protein